MRKRDVTVGRSVKFTDHALAVSASVSCMDIGHFDDSIDEVNASDVAFWHYDVVDGHFNRCFILGDLLYPHLRKMSLLPIEVHLAVEEPEHYIDIFSRYELDYVAVHAEAMKSPERAFQKIRVLGAQPVLSYRRRHPGMTLRILQRSALGCSNSQSIRASRGKRSKMLRSDTSERCVIGLCGPAAISGFRRMAM